MLQWVLLSSTFLCCKKPDSLVLNFRIVGLAQDFNRPGLPKKDLVNLRLPDPTTTELAKRKPLKGALLGGSSPKPLSVVESGSDLKNPILNPLVRLSRVYDFNLGHRSRDFAAQKTEDSCIRNHYHEEVRV